MAIAGDLYTTFDYATLLPAARRMAGQAIPGMHLVMVPNPPFHPRGDFSLRDDGWLAIDELGETAQAGRLDEIAQLDVADDEAAELHGQIENWQTTFLANKGGVSIEVRHAARPTQFLTLDAKQMPLFSSGLQDFIDQAGQRG